MDTQPVVPVPADVVDFIHGHSGFIVIGHREPDADCVGSQLSLGNVLRRMGKKVTVFNPGPFERQEILLFQDQFDRYPETDHLGPSPAAIIVDCSGEDRIGSAAKVIKELPVLVIDHHINGSAYGDVHFVRPEIPAATILVTAVIMELGQKIVREDAFLLFLGLVTDTGFFRFLGPGELTAFATATVLSKAGASPRDVDIHIRSGRSFESRQLISRMLDRVERLREGRILLTYQTLADEREIGAKRDSDALYSLLLSVEGVEVIAVVKERAEGCTVSFRSSNEIDVGNLATEFGGGGHQKASGAYYEGRLLDFLAILRSRLNSLL
ncbi:MAG: bifunctional oligoribonuclease/PAP phosphatase NrnA [Alkalispirochaeta sp.]